MVGHIVRRGTATSGTLPNARTRSTITPAKRPNGSTASRVSATASRLWSAKIPVNRWLNPIVSGARLTTWGHSIFRIDQFLSLPRTPGPPPGLVLQLHLVILRVAVLHSLRLVSAAPARPAKGGGQPDRRPEHEACEKHTDLGCARQESKNPLHAARTFGLVSFALPGSVEAGRGLSHVVRRRSAARRARKAAAAMTSVT